MPHSGPATLEELQASFAQLGEPLLSLLPPCWVSVLLLGSEVAAVAQQGCGDWQAGVLRRRLLTAADAGPLQRCMRAHSGCMPCTQARPSQARGPLPQPVPRV